MDKQSVLRMEFVAYEKRTDLFHWCSECKQTFAEDHPDFDFSLCPLCRTGLPGGFLPWSWLRTHWKGALPAIPEPGVQYEAHPDMGGDAFMVQ